MSTISPEKVSQIYLETTSNEVFLKAISTVPVNPYRGNIIFTAGAVESRIDTTTDLERYTQECLAAHVTPFYKVEMEYDETAKMFCITNRTLLEAYIAKPKSRRAAINEGILRGYQPHSVEVKWGQFKNIGLPEPKNYRPFRDKTIPYLKELGYQPEHGILSIQDEEFGMSGAWIALGKGIGFRSEQMNLAGLPKKEGLTLNFAGEVTDVFRDKLSSWFRSLPVTINPSRS